MLKRFYYVSLVLFAVQANAQSLWRDIAETAIPESFERRIIPQRYRTVQLDVAALQGLFQKVKEGNAGVSTDLYLPLPDGEQVRFRIEPSAVMAPGLQQRYPGIRTYSGYSPDDPTALLKCDWTPWGFHAMWSSAHNGTVFIDPYAHGHTEYYVVYHK
ncbi:MAG: hypothetical protein EP344_04035, partial [Bacteroidetes bacterium]